MNSLTKLSINLLFLIILNGCGDNYDPTTCPPDCPDGLSTSSIIETDNFMLGKYDLFMRQISDEQATEFTGVLDINTKISNGLYSAVLKGRAYYTLFDGKWKCDIKSPQSISCTDRKSVEKFDWNVIVTLSTDGVKMTINTKNDDIDIYMDIHASYIGRRLGREYYTGEETYLIAKIANEKSALDFMNLNLIK